MGRNGEKSFFTPSGLRPLLDRIFIHVALKQDARRHFPVELEQLPETHSVHKTTIASARRSNQELQTMRTQDEHNVNVQDNTRYIGVDVAKATLDAKVLAKFAAERRLEGHQ